MIEKIERLILDCIERANKRKKLSCILDKVASYKGELADIEVFIRNHRSAVLVSFNAERLQEDEDGETLLETEFIVLCFARSEGRKESNTRFGAVYPLIEDMKALLHKNSLGFLAEPLVYQGCEPVFNTKFSSYHTAMYELRFSGRYPISNFDPDDRDDEKLDRFETLVTDWELPQFSSQTTVKLEQDV